MCVRGHFCLFSGLLASCYGKEVGHLSRNREDDHGVRRERACVMAPSVFQTLAQSENPIDSGGVHTGSIKKLQIKFAGI